jgi:hypothetical protein
MLSAGLESLEIMDRWGKMKSQFLNPPGAD